MNRLVSALSWDVRLQNRYGFYAVYSVVTGMYVAGVLVAPDAWIGWLAPLVIFSDPAFLGFYFIAALVLFEKGEGVINALVTSPLTTGEYLLSKAASLTLLATLASIVLALAAAGLQVSFLPLLVSVMLTSVLFVFVGFVAVARFDSLNAYFMTAIVYLMPFSLPFLPYFGVLEHPLFYLLPTHGSLLLLSAGFEPVPTWQLAYAVAYLAVWCIAAFVAARRAFDHHIVAGVSETAERGAPVSRRARLDGQRFGPIGTLALADLRNWARDPLLIAVAFAPILAAVVLRFALPLFSGWLAETVALAPYYPLFAVLVVLLAPAMMGFVVGFFVLEERDQSVLLALRTTPLTGRGYLAYRGVSTYVVSAVLAVVVAPLFGLVTIPLTVLLGVAAVGALWSWVAALLLTALSENAVEGVAVSKFLGLLLMVPLAAIALLDGPLELAAGVFPLYWPTKALVVGLVGGWTFLAYLAVGAAYHLVIAWALARRFVARAD